MGAAGRKGDGDDKSGKGSLVNTADMSEEDADDQLDATAGAIERQEVLDYAPTLTSTNGHRAESGSNRASFDAPKNIAAAGGVQACLSLHPLTGSESQERAQDQSVITGVTLPPNAEVEGYQANMFDVLEGWILEYLRDKLHCGFLLSSHFQEYTRFLHVQQKPVTENDFILFRILGRGGFGAVNGASTFVPYCTHSVERAPV